MRIFLSYSSQDRAEAATVAAALRGVRPDLEIFDERSLASGGPWMPRLQQEIAAADGFIFLFGNTIGQWQSLEYYGALDRRANTPSLPIVPVLMADANVSGLRFIDQLQWIKSDTPAAPDTIARILATLPAPQAKDPFAPVGAHESPLELANDPQAATRRSYVPNLVRRTRTRAAALRETALSRLTVAYAGWSKSPLRIRQWVSLAFVAKATGVLACAVAAWQVADAWSVSTAQYAQERSATLTAPRNEGRLTPVRGGYSVMAVGSSLGLVKYAAPDRTDIALAGHHSRIERAVCDGTAIISVDTGGGVRKTEVGPRTPSRLLPSITTAIEVGVRRLAVQRGHRTGP